MANSWHEPALNIKCQGGRCDSQHYMIGWHPSDKLQTAPLMQNRSLLMWWRIRTFNAETVKQLKHMFSFVFHTNIYKTTPDTSACALSIAEHAQDCGVLWFSIRTGLFKWKNYFIHAVGLNTAFPLWCYNDPPACWSPPPVMLSKKGLGKDSAVIPPSEDIQLWLWHPSWVTAS